MDWLATTRDAFALLFTGDVELWQVVFISLRVSILAMLIAAPLAIAFGYFLATASFPGRRTLIVITQGLLASPTVVVGLILYLLLSRQGVFGSLKLLFTQEAMIIGQVLSALPVVGGIYYICLSGTDPRALGNRN